MLLLYMCYCPPGQILNLFWDDRSNIWTNMTTLENSLELPNGIYICNIHTGGNAVSGKLCSENNKLWQLWGVFHWIKNKKVNDNDRIPKVEVNVDYLHTQNHMSNEDTMKLTLIRTPSASSDYVPYWKTQIKFGESILPSDESKIRLTFTMRKLFDLTEY